MSYLNFYPHEGKCSRINSVGELLDYFTPFHGAHPASVESSPLHRLPLDVYSTDQTMVVVASLPGLSPDEIEVTLEDNTLTIEGELKGPQENVRYLLQQRAYGRFSRSVVLNTPVDWEHMDAHYENGVLTLTIPKAEVVKPKTIRIKSHGSNA